MRNFEKDSWLLPCAVCSLCYVHTAYA